MKRTIRWGTFESNSSSMHSIVINKMHDVYTPEEMKEGMYFGSDGVLYLYDMDLSFGRSPFEILCTFYDKMRYAIAEFCGYEPKAKADEEAVKIIDIARKYIPELQEVKFDTSQQAQFRDEDGNVVAIEDLEWLGRGLHSYERNGVKYENVFMVRDERRYDVPDVYRQYFVDDPFDRPLPDGFFYQKNGAVGFAPLLPDPVIVNEYGDIDHQSAGLLKKFLAKENITLEEFLTEKQYMVVIDGDEYCQFEKLLEHNIIARDKIQAIYDNFSLEDVSEDNDTD